VPSILIWISAGMTIVGTGTVLVAEIKAPLIPAILFPLSCLFLTPALYLWRSAVALRQGRCDAARGASSVAVAASVIAALIVLLGGFLEDDCNDAVTCEPDHAAATMLYLGGKIFLASGALSIVALLAMGATWRKYGSIPKAQ
jgi:hypothetical protein